MTQMLRVRKTDTTFTLWYQPNTIAAAQLSKHPEAKALRFSFSLTDAEVGHGIEVCMHAECSVLHISISVNTMLCTVVDPRHKLASQVVH